MKQKIKKYLSSLKENYQKILQKIKASKLVQKLPNNSKFLSRTAGITILAAGLALIITSVGILVASFSSLLIIDIVLLILLGVVGIAFFPLAYFVYKKLLNIVISDNTKDKIVDIIDKIDGDDTTVE